MQSLVLVSTLLFAADPRGKLPKPSRLQDTVRLVVSCITCVFKQARCSMCARRTCSVPHGVRRVQRPDRMLLCLLLCSVYTIYTQVTGVRSQHAQVTEHCTASSSGAECRLRSGRVTLNLTVADNGQRRTPQAQQPHTSHTVTRMHLGMHITYTYGELILIYMEVARRRECESARPPPHRRRVGASRPAHGGVLQGVA